MSEAEFELEPDPVPPPPPPPSPEVLSREELRDRYRDVTEAVRRAYLEVIT